MTLRACVTPPPKPTLEFLLPPELLLKIVARSDAATLVRSQRTMRLRRRTRRRRRGIRTVTEGADKAVTAGIRTMTEGTDKAARPGEE
ncbi:Os12g0592766 [Oryza sativa Japonica Group]|uniref:Os12g0592766 protein n=1 Tax=Oryza sativa subsp. japonica TaxID=39947 RepID=A0A0P0YC31_ORYSJ|nr:Os12g0592766 [Oryza sativa Japonica Group]